MIAGTLARLDTPTDDALESFAGDFTALDARETYEYLDGATVQYGLAAGDVETTVEEVSIEGSSIDVDRHGSRTRTHTAWVADVQDAGFVAAERTAGSDPPFPFDIFRARCSTPVEPVEIDVPAFVRAFEDIVLEMSMSKAETAEGRPNDVSIGYGRDANQAGGNTGVMFRAGWNDTTASGVIYASGYVAIWEETWGAVQFGAFVRDAVLPHATVPDADAQQTLDGAVCADCGHERDSVQETEYGRLCAVCLDARENEGVGA